MTIPSTTNLTASPNPSVCGQDVTFTATVKPATGGPPTGTVDFTISADGPPLTAPVIASEDNGVASVSVNNLSVSPPNHSVVAAYSGDTHVDTSNSTPVIQTLTKAGSATTLTALPTSSVCGQLVVYTATVAPTCPSTGIPGGSVLFTVPGGPATSVALVGGVANFVATPAVGFHTAIAVYGGDGCFSPSTGSVLHTTTKADSVVTLTANPNPSTAGQPVTFTATVTAMSPSVGTPTGAVNFSIDGSLGSPVPLSGEQASFSTGTLTGGLHTVTVGYHGDDCFNPSTSSPLTQIVQGDLNTTKLTAAPATIQVHTNGTFFLPALSATLTNTATNAPVPGQPITFTANPVIGPVMFGTAVTTSTGTATLSNVTVSATLITASQYTATFAGSSGFTPSTTMAPLTFQPVPLVP